MRDYSQIRPQFWTGATGQQLRTGGPEALVVALYLMTSPHANMLGLYHLPVMYLAHETGLTEKGAWKGLRRCIEAQFCTFDGVSEHVFVHEMARFQIGDQLKAADKRCKGVWNVLRGLPKGALRRAFWEKYHTAFHLPDLPDEASPTGGASKPLPKPLRSQEQEQEQEQEQCSAEEREKPRNRRTVSRPQQPPVAAGAAPDPQVGAALRARSGAPNDPPNDPQSTNSVTEQPATKPRPRPQVEIDTWLDALPPGTPAVRADDTVFAYAAEIGIPGDFVELAWVRFGEEMRVRHKRQRDWPAHFRNAVRNNWGRLWWFDASDGGTCKLTTVGEQARRSLQADLHAPEAAA